MWSGLDTRQAQRAVSLLVLLSSVGVVWLGVQDSQRADCTARYNERSAQSQQARAEAAEHDRDALEALVRSLVDDNTADGRQQVERYLTEIEKTDQERRDNPVPPPPADLCH